MAIAREENGEFCATVGSVARTASILTQSVKRRWLLIWAGHPADLGCMLA